MKHRVLIPSDSVRLEGEFAIPKQATGIVLFAHGSGSSRLSPRNQFVVEAPQNRGIGTVLFDLLTEGEAGDRENVIDIKHLGVSDGYIEAEIARQLKKVNRRETTYRGSRAGIPLAGKTVIIVDDGIATGSSARAALRGVRRQKPARLILATPVAPTETVEALRNDADEIVCLETPEDFIACGPILWRLPAGLATTR
jgi:predicted phosphoribosyltransferase